MLREGQECESKFIARVEEKLSSIQPSIKLACSSDPFSQELIVVESPQGIDADKVISEVFPNGVLVDNHRITGPWLFELRLD